MVGTHRRGFSGKTQELSKRVEAVPQSAYKKRGENPATAEHGILPTPIIEFSSDYVPIDGRVPYQLRRIVNIVKSELEYLKLRGFSTSAAHGIRNKPIVDYLREDLFNQMQQDELRDSLGYGWTGDFALDVLDMTDTQTNMYMARIAQ